MRQQSRCPEMPDLMRSSYSSEEIYGFLKDCVIFLYFDKSVARFHEHTV